MPRARPLVCASCLQKASLAHDPLSRESPSRSRSSCLRRSYRGDGWRRHAWTLPHSSSEWRFVYPGSTGGRIAIAGCCSSMTWISSDEHDVDRFDAALLRVIATLRGLGARAGAAPTDGTCPTLVDDIWRSSSVANIPSEVLVERKIDTWMEDRLGAQKCQRSCRG